MQYSEGQLGRVFVLRLEHGDPMPQVLEQFAAEHGVTSAVAFMVGGADDASKLVVGPENGMALPAVPMLTELVGPHEVAGVGMIFPDAAGQPMLHMHAACGRNSETITGCIRAGIRTWHVLEVVLIEITGLQAARLFDEKTGFQLLQCETPND